jgi:malonyl-CoA/methylmalonyl-CoA synthetase
MPDSELLFHRAARFASRIAVADASGEHSFRALDERSSAVAAALLAGGADLAEARVAYLIPPSVDHVAVQWGIWRAGAVAVPIAASHPAREIEYLLDDSQPSVAIASREQWARLGPLAEARGLRTLIVEDLPPNGVGALPSVSAERRALIVYTSGTTGRPKGVVSTHSTLRAQVTTLAEAWGWTAQDRSLHVLPLHHVHGIINALSCALWCGATVEFMATFAAEPCWERLASGEITVFTAVPTIYGRLIAAFDAADPPTRSRWAAGVRRLRLMMSGSAALPVSVLERWEAIAGHRLLERYGMTEIGMALTNPLSGERRAGTVGQPFAGVEARLIDEAGAPCPTGTPGEIEIKSPQMFREYWNRPDETARAFRDGWFATGDVAVIDDGYWRLLGRQSVDIIKSAGYKISALEIEEVVREHPAVLDCAVVGRPDDDLGERIGAAVVVAAPLSPDDLRGWLKERLAPYKVPRDVLMVAELPRNAMGKVTKPEVKMLFA